MLSSNQSWLQRMNKVDLLKCLVCAGGISCGQLLFKMASSQLNKGVSALDIKFILLVGLSFALYAATSILWIFLLKRIPLSTGYIFLASTYVIVPFCAALLFDEVLRPQFWIGATLIGAGVFITAR
jgi:drug/metabolite transporter (DMT)-like permease